jgi:hypothetical protein
MCLCGFLIGCNLVFLDNCLPIGNLGWSHVLVVDPLLDSDDGLVGVFLVLEHCSGSLALIYRRMNQV